MKYLSVDISTSSSPGKSISYAPQITAPFELVIKIFPSHVEKERLCGIPRGGTLCDIDKGGKICVTYTGEERMLVVDGEGRLCDIQGRGKLRDIHGGGKMA